MGPRGRRRLTSESVTEGHPDKMADQISDAILDAVLAEDPVGRVACETLVTTGLAIVAGEITTRSAVDFPKVVRETIKEIGYTRAEHGFDYHTCGVLACIHEQSADIALGVDPGGAGDQGMMYGYACTETDELMPLPIVLAHRLCRRLAQVRKEGLVAHLGPDGKSQVTIEYEGQRPIRVDTVVVSAQHRADVSADKVREDVIEHVIAAVVPPGLIDQATRLLVNPTGRFVIGGPQGDCGVTGRKTVVDTYGGAVPHGGGAFSGKDPTKVDRSASYMARYIAKNCVAAGLAERCLIQLAYAIGVADPISLEVETFGTGRLPEARIIGLVRAHFALTPRGMIEQLGLRRPIYRKTAAYGHFGRGEAEFTWERTDKAAALRVDAGL